MSKVEDSLTTQKPDMPASQTGGVKAMSIARRMVNVRQRLTNMTDEERAWRAQYLKDQILAPDEPKILPAYYKARYNPIRRFYRAPMQAFETALIPYAGLMGAQVIRHTIAKAVMGIFGIYCAFYYFKYNAHDWTRVGGWRVGISRPAMFPGDPNWPNYEKKLEGKDFYSAGFEKSVI